jgi:tetratricopeptide (TPR) repeat protein
MKNATLCFSLIISLSFNFLNAQENNRYQQEMQQTLALYDSVKTLSDYKNIVNRFERVAAAEKEEWLPAYYAGLTYVYMSFVGGLEDDARDEYLDQATKWVEQAYELAPNNAEIIVLEGYVKMAKVSVSPAIRGAYMSSQVSTLFGKAVKIDPKNPRALYMQGRWKIGMAQFFGSNTDEACALVAASLPLFKAENAESIQPHWGLSQAQRVNANCNK